MTSIYLIRHGQASFGEENYDQLSPLGESQASRLGEALAQRVGVFDAVCVGAMQRHRQTAQTCLSSMSASVQPELWQTDARWNEYDHQEILACSEPQFETAAGVKNYLQQQADPKQALRRIFLQAMQRWMGGEHDDYSESWLAYQQRVRAALEHVTVAYRDHQHVAVFTSGGPIALVSQYLLGVPTEKLMFLNWTLLNCGVTKLVLSEKHVFVASLNEHTAFEGPHKHLISYR